MNTFLSRPISAPAPEPASTFTPLVLTLESLDGARKIPLDGSTGWWRLPGTAGLDMPAFDVVTAAAPGVHGSVLQDVRVQQRAVQVPVFTTSSAGRIDHLEMLDAIRSLVDPLVGEFLLVGSGPRGSRELRVVYTGGLEGSDGRDEFGLYWRKLGLTAVACDPFAYDRAERLVEFETAASGAPLIGVVGGTDALWPGALSSSVVIGEGMEITVASEVPVYPTLELVGPMTSFVGTMSTGWSVDVPLGVAAGSTLRIVTDPRSRSIRLNDALAAGSVARGSALRPFYPGVNVLDVVAPGGTDATRIRLSWREAHRSLW